MIVFVCIPWFSPAYKGGGPIQSITNLIEQFANKDLQYKIFCGNRDLDGSELIVSNTNCWVNYSSNTQVYYSDNNTTSDIKNQIEIVKPNILFIIGMFSYKYNVVPMLLKYEGKKILSARGMLHPGALLQKRFKKILFIQFLKSRNITKNIFFHATDKQEETYIKNIFGQNAQTKIASNFGKVIKECNSIEKIEGKLSIITVALISPMKNHLQVLQALKKCALQIKYTICGPIKDKAYWNLCKYEIDTMPSNISINVTGELPPNEIENLLQQHHIFIMPSKSENFGHSIFEALSCGLPVITSKNTPWNELDENKAGINIISNVENIRNAISTFAALNKHEYEIFTEGALKYFETKNNVENTKQQYKNLFYN